MKYSFTLHKAELLKLLDADIREAQEAISDLEKNLKKAEEALVKDYRADFVLAQTQSDILSHQSTIRWTERKRAVVEAAMYEDFFCEEEL